MLKLKHQGSTEETMQYKATQRFIFIDIKKKEEVNKVIKKIKKESIKFDRN